MRHVRLLAVAVLAVLMLAVPAANAAGSWQIVTSPTTKELYSLFMISSSEGWAVGLNGVILHYSGGSWSLYTSPTTNNLYSVHMLSSFDGWATGTILQYSDSPPSSSRPVGGFIEPINKLTIAAPYLALFGLAAVVVVAVAPWKKRGN